MSYYIYKYVVNNEIVYIGQSINLRNRIAQHKQDKLRIIKDPDIYYFECLNKTAMISWEYNLINKYHPKYNAALNNKEENIHIEEPNWILYNENNFPNIIKKKEEKQKETKSLNIDINYLLNNNQNTNSIKETNIIYHFYDCSCFEQKLMIYLLIKSKLLNISLNEITGNTNEYYHFCYCDPGNTYKHIKNISNIYLKKIETNTFQLTEKGINSLVNFEELDIDDLINILKYIKSKYTCFILDALLQTEDYILYIEELQNYLENSYLAFSHLRRKIIEPAIREANLIGFNLLYFPKKNGQKYTAICFKDN